MLLLSYIIEQRGARSFAPTIIAFSRRSPVLWAGIASSDCFLPFQWLSSMARNPLQASPGAAIRSSWRPWLLASCTALCTALPSLCEPTWPLIWVAFLPFLVAIRDATGRQAFFLGWWAETFMYWLGFYWLIGTMVDFGYIPLPISIVLFAIIGIGNGIRMGLFACWLRWLTRMPLPWWGHLLFPAALWVGFEYLFPRVFPWYLGCWLFPAPIFTQLADITGVPGLSFLLLIASTTGAAWIAPHTHSLRERQQMSAVCLLLILLQTGYGLWRMQYISAVMQQAPKMRVAMLQTNVGMYEKRQGVERQERLDMQMAMSQKALAQHPHIILWPESMYPYALPTDRDLLPLPGLPEDTTAYWLLGILSFSGRGATRQVFNSAVLVGPDMGIIERYDKRHLLAFGEYIPLQKYFPFLRHISPTIGNLTAGSGGVVTLPTGIRLGPLICYEDILVAAARQSVQQGAQILVNLTNDVWFGPTRAPYQHRTLAAFRAIEHRVYLLRVTNTGLTSVIDALGRERARLPIYQRDTLLYDVEPLRLTTLYTRFGDWFAQLCSVAALGITLWQFRRRRMVP